MIGQYDKEFKEVKELPNVLSIEEKDMGRHSSFRNIYALKSRYLDFLDHLYGVESQPEWLEVQLLW